MVACSSLYETAPVGPQDQPHFINQAVALDTALSAQDLLKALQSIENNMGRIRDGVHWGPRIDIHRDSCSALIIFFCLE